MKCPNCGSENCQYITTTETHGGGISWGDACCGTMLLIVLGTLIDNVEYCAMWGGGWSDLFVSMIESFLIGWIFERVLIKYSGNTYLFKFGMTKEKYVNIEKDLNHMNADRWYVAVLIYGTEFKVYCLERDEEMIQNLIQIEKDFWNNHVQAGVIPEPDGSKLADKVLTEYFSDPVDEIVELSGYQEKLERRGELKKLIEKMTTEVSLIEQEIKLLMGNAERAKADNYRISWKASQRTDLDSKRMKAEEPEIYDRFKRTSVSRRFVVRAA